MTNLDVRTQEIIEREYVRDDNPWALGYSGGKDSTAMMKLVFKTLIGLNRKKDVNIVYCDTGVEIPIIKEYVKEVFSEIKIEIAKYELPIRTLIVEPELKDRFFSKVIGHGYPSPTNKFRWCTDRMRIRPIQKAMYTNKYVVLVGVRKGESKERDKIIRENLQNEDYYLRQKDYPGIKIFAPIVNYDIRDVWDTIKSNYAPKSINGEKLELLYREAGNITEESISKDILAGGRFGCWTCTVVRKDKAMNNLINSGYSRLIPLYEFRNWLYDIRDKSDYRCKHRRNGGTGLGPFTLSARELILKRLIDAQNKSKYSLITDEEISYIEGIWNNDKNSNIYSEN